MSENIVWLVVALGSGRLDEDIAVECAVEAVDIQGAFNEFLTHYWIAQDPPINIRIRRRAKNFRRVMPIIQPDDGLEGWGE